MNLIGELVKHKAFGEGKVTKQDEQHITIEFKIGEKVFSYPIVFNNHLTINNQEVSDLILNEIKVKNENLLKIQREKEEQIVIEKELERALEARKKKKEKYIRENIAFKCNYCDGGKSNNRIGYNGVCSDDVIHNNIVIEKRTWCGSEGSSCRQYLDGDISRMELDKLCENDDFVCYESQMLRNWKALAGIVQTGVKKGTPMKLNSVQQNSLCILTTREPHMDEVERFIFAVFLVDETYEGDNDDEGYVTTTSEYKIALTPKEAKSLLFWKYHANTNKPEKTTWSSGLHRYFNDDHAVQILSDIAVIKRGTEDEDLAERFLIHFCNVNRFNIEDVSESNGALAKIKVR